MSDIRDEIHAAVERERRQSRHRDRRTGDRIHPYQHDINRLLAFVIDRRKSRPGALHLVQRACRVVDADALRQLVVIVRDGNCDMATLNRCDRVMSYCQTIEEALALRPVEITPMEEDMSRLEVTKALRESLNAFVPALTEDILAKADECSGDLDAYVQAVKDAAEQAIAPMLAAQRAETEALRLDLERRIAQDAEQQARLLEFRDSVTSPTVH